MRTHRLNTLRRIAVRRRPTPHEWTPEHLLQCFACAQERSRYVLGEPTAPIPGRSGS